MSIVKSIMGSSLAGAQRSLGQAQSQAANIGAEHGQLGIDELRRQFSATEAAFGPTIAQGQGAFDQQAALSGALGPEAQALAFQNFQSSPGQQFLQQQGEKALLRNAAATGDLGGGRTKLGLIQHGMGLAQQDLGNQFARLGSVAAPGLEFQSRLGGMRGNLGVNTANLLGGIGQAKGTALTAPFSANVAAQKTRDQAIGNLIEGGVGLASEKGWFGL